MSRCLLYDLPVSKTVAAAGNKLPFYYLMALPADSGLDPFLLAVRGSQNRPAGYHMASLGRDPPLYLPAAAGADGRLESFLTAAGFFFRVP